MELLMERVITHNIAAVSSPGNPRPPVRSISATGIEQAYTCTSVQAENTACNRQSTLRTYR